MSPIRVGVLTGGSTPERPVALAGARQVVAALRSRGMEVTVVDTCGGALDPSEEEHRLPESVAREAPPPEELERLRAEEDLVALLASGVLRDVDVVWPLLHGLQGEGGEVQSLLEAAGLAYAGSDARGSTLAMDKEVAKVLMESAGIRTPRWCTWREGADPPTVEEWPVVVKPSRVGSTVGLSVVRDAAHLARALRSASAFDDDVLVEEFLPGRELTVGVLRDEALAVGEIRTRGEVFDFESKYQPGAATEIFPAEIPEELAEEVRDLGLAVHRVLKLRDFSRVDVRLDAQGRPCCLEANTLPGMTRTSLLPQSAASAGIPFSDLCALIVELALYRR